ncbi:MAG: hypothetical protein FJ011_09315 [Chloroflexi bacterium]|nr:hypothetical protein [Chloroflexota bacterium]
MRYARPLVVLLALVCVGGCVPLPAALPPSGAATAAQQMTIEPAALNQMPVGVLEARRVAAAPRLDGTLDAVWASSTPVHIPLDGAREPSAAAVLPELVLRAVYTSDALFFLARWDGEPPSGAVDTTFNQLTVHWTVPLPAGAPAPACAVACHTAHVDGQGRVAYMNSETIPQGGEDALPAAGGWADSHWAIAWSRPLVNANPYDLQFSDLGASYLFFVKVFARAEGRPDPISKPYALAFVADQ